MRSEWAKPGEMSVIVIISITGSSYNSIYNSCHSKNCSSKGSEHTRVKESSYNIVLTNEITNILICIHFSP